MGEPMMQIQKAEAKANAGECVISPEVRATMREIMHASEVQQARGMRERFTRATSAPDACAVARCLQGSQSTRQAWKLISDNFVASGFDRDGFALLQVLKLHGEHSPPPVTSLR
eukprot:3024480-Pleurochrysis_carterae.AAC.1